MMRIASAAPAADLIPGPASADDPTTATAFAAELDVATPQADALAAEPATPASDVATTADEAPPAPIATTLDPDTVAAVLAAPIVLSQQTAHSEAPAETPAEGLDGASGGDTPELAVGLATRLAAEPLPVAPSLPTDAPVAASVPEQAAVGAPTPLPQELADSTPPAADASAADDIESALAEEGADAASPTVPAASASQPATATPTPTPTPTPTLTANPAAATPEAATSDRPPAEPRQRTEAAPASVAASVAAPAAALATPAAAPATDPARSDATTPTPNVAPVAAPAPVTAPAAVTPANPVAAPRLLDQVRLPIAALRELPDGAHLVTVHVTPDELGPVTVRALVQGGALDVQLTAPTDAAREALKALLPDLRRDLSQGGQPALLSLGDATTDGAPARDRDATRDAFARPGRDAAPEASDSRPVAPVRAGTTSLDVLA